MEQFQYFRKCNLIISNEKGDGLDLSNFRIVFNVKKSDSQTPNSAQIRIYNLTQDTANKIRSEYQNVILQAGYESNYGVIFSGNIKQLLFGRENGTDSFVDLSCGDGDKAYNYAIVNTTLSAGSNVNQHIEACLGSMSSSNISKGYLPDLSTSSLPRGKVLFGMSRDYLRKASESTETSWSIQDGKLQFVKLTEVLPNQAVVLTSKTGLIGTPEQTNDGIKVKCLLNPLLKIASQINLNEDSIANAKLQKTDKDAQVNAPSPINKDGFYRILVIEHNGDTRGQDWYSDLICLSVDSTAPNENKVRRNG